MSQNREVTAAEIGALGGKARAARMTPAERKESARKAALARWAAVREAAEGPK